MYNAVRMKSSLLLLVLFGIPAALWSQKSWVFFEDKGPEAAWYQSHPESMLSPLALAKRIERNLPLDSRDIPVSISYLNTLSEAGITLYQSSRWLNAVSVNTDLDLVSLQALCPQISSMQPVEGMNRATVEPDAFIPAPPQPRTSGTTAFDYGQTLNQIEMLNVDCLHDRGYTGSGIVVAVFDSGFEGMDMDAAYDSLWLNNRYLGGFDFVENNDSVFQDDFHGASVSSCFLGFIPGSYVGSGPEVSVLLARTEDISQEVHQEEDNWVAALEWADSIGVDIIQNSLAYTTFDPGEGDYSYADMDGNTAIITRAADLAASRGILVVTAAGNDGNNSWRYIAAPADADSVLTVGAVNGNEMRVSFSSQGPTFDGRIKPDIMARGAGTSVVYPSGFIGTSSGTSFAAPLMTGLAACLMQAHPLRSHMDIINSIQKSGDRYLMPDTLYGFGIPDACRADSILSYMDSVAASVPESSLEGHFNLYPQPAQNEMVLESVQEGVSIARITLISLSGQVVQNIVYPDSPLRKVKINTEQLADGMYILQLETAAHVHYVQRFHVHQ